MSNSLFQNVAMKKPPRNKFDLSHDRKMSLNMGDLVPILCQEVLPGDQFRVSSEVFMRMAPMLAPMMHNVNVTVHYFYVPNRILWDNWESFITGGRLGTSAPVAPAIRINSETVGTGKFFTGTLADYLGLPTIPIENVVPEAEVNINSLPFRAYQLIYDEYYRDQNVQASLDISKADGVIVGNNAEFAKLTTLRRRAWEKDYFTSAQPNAQRGAEVLIPIDTVAESADIAYRPYSNIFNEDGTAVTDDTLLGSNSVTLSGNALIGNKVTNSTVGQRSRVENIESVTATNGSATIEDLRTSTMLQKFLELMQRGGSRLKEVIKAHFNVNTKDGRLQRPEYLGGGKQPMKISEVLSTFQGETGNPQGNMAGHGISGGSSNSFNRFFEEHGFVIGILSVLPVPAYQQGIPRMFTQRDTRLKYYWPSFANLGEQEVINHELYYDHTDDTENFLTFGYQSRYCEYKYVQPTVHGDMRSSLAFWHMGRIFESRPLLNESFIQSDPTNRIFAVESESVHKLYCQVYNRVDALRPLPYFNVPSLV